MIEREYSEVDDKLVSEFEQAWLGESPRPIEQFLPEESAASFLGTLEELVHIDLEFRWKASAQESGEARSKPPTIEHYLVRFPQLQSVKLGLIQGEFELLHRFGSGASIDDFVGRFGDSVDHQELSEVLNAQLSQLNRDRRIQPGVTLGRYEIVNEHGRGGFGAVWRATDTKLGRRIAVKQLGHRLAGDAESRRRFISEARVTARLEHPGIVPVYDISNLQDDHAYYTMRLIRGRTLEQAINDLHALDSSGNEFQLQRRQLLQSFVDVCRTIEYAHAQGVVHRDLKPQNIIVGNYGETILLDWGLASVVEDARGTGTDQESLGADPEVLSLEESVQTLEGRVMGTPAYMSPEQARGEIESVQQASDVYSLGATLYHLVTGLVPFTDAPLESLLERVKVGEIPDSATINNSVEKPLSHIVAKAMRVPSAERYSSVADLVADVQRFQADQPVTAYRDSLWATAARWIRKHPTTAAASALTLLFGVVAIAASLSISHAWKNREQQRIAALQVAAERADATAISQIKNGRFQSASNTLSQGIQLLDGERSLENLAARLTARNERTQKIVDFYALGLKAQEETFFDRTNRSATYCQAALNELEVLQHSDWWSQLPDADLSPLQKDQLQSEIYRIVTLLASMRLAGISDDAVSLNILLNPSSIDPNAESVKAIRAASFAAAAANRFRPSRAMQMIEQVGQVIDGKRTTIDFTNLNPLNSIDSAVMGSILDNNVPPDGLVRRAVSGLLEMRNPNVVAKQWLDDALKYNPDWYWLPVFAGYSQVKTEQAEEAIRTISHAVGVRPDYWVGYQYRALASVSAAVSEKSEKRKAELLNSANRDIQRAMDLQPNNSELFWTRAIIQYQSQTNPDQIVETFLTAFQLHQNIGEIEGGHYSGISKMYYARAQAFVEWQKSQGLESSRLALLESAISYWQDQLTEAKQLVAASLENHPGDSELRKLSQLIENRMQEDSKELIETDGFSRFDWHYRMSNASILGKAKRWQDQAAELREAIEATKAEWQKSRAQVELVACLARLDKEDQAIELLRETMELDRAVDISLVKTVAAELERVQLFQLCQQLTDQAEPPMNSERLGDIDHPALLNSNFELGLSYHWAPFSRRTTTTSWNNVGKSNTIAEAVSLDSDKANRCLRLQVDCPIESESFGTMAQSVPVTKAKQYELLFSAKVESLTEGSVRVGVMDGHAGDFEQVATLQAGDGTWQQYRLPVASKLDKMTIAIRAQGKGVVLIDDLRVMAVGKN